jgi:hypothetical protein
MSAPTGPAGHHEAFANPPPKASALPRNAGPRLDRPSSSARLSCSTPGQRDSETQTRLGTRSVMPRHANRLRQPSRALARTSPPPAPDLRSGVHPRLGFPPSSPMSETLRHCRDNGTSGDAPRSSNTATSGNCLAAPAQAPRAFTNGSVFLHHHRRARL